MQEACLEADLILSASKITTQRKRLWSPTCGHFLGQLLTFFENLSLMRDQSRDPLLQNEENSPFPLLLIQWIWEQKSKWVLGFLHSCTSRKVTWWLQLKQCNRKKIKENNNNKLRQLYKEKNNNQESYIFLSTLIQSWKPESLCWMLVDGWALLDGEHWGMLTVPRSDGLLCTSRAWITTASRLL